MGRRTTPRNWPRTSPVISTPSAAAVKGARHERASPGHGDRRSRGRPGQRPASRRGHRHCPAAGAAAGRADRRAWPRCRRRPLRRMVRRHGQRRPGGVGRPGGGRPAADPLPAGPGAARHPLGLHADLHLQDRPRAAAHHRPALLRLPRAPGVIAMRNPALDAWGGYDRDDPYPLFAQVQGDGPVHEVTLADGHRAWLIVRHAEARAALNHAGLSKDMHAALARDGAVVAEGPPGPAFARHMLSVDPPDHTRLRRLVSSAFTPRRVEELRPRVQEMIDDLLDELAAKGPDARVDLVEAFAFPLPFFVICELLGVPEGDRSALGRGLSALLVPTPTPEAYASAKAASDQVVAMLEGLVDAKQRQPGDDLVSALITARDGNERLSTQELLSTIFQLIVAGHDTTASFIGNSMVALFRQPDQ